jgi:hypothetical protein
MSSEVLSFIFGGLLILTGIIGGGFEIKELKIPKVTWPTRLAALAVGLLFIGMGLSPPNAVPEADAASRPPTQSRPITFTITDRLGEGQLSEQVTLLLNGRRIGMLSVNQHYPYSELPVTVPQEGRYSYTAEAAAVFETEGELVEYYGVGQGAIDVEGGKTFELAASVSGNTWLVTLLDTAP